MIAYENEDGSVATCSKQSSVPEGATWIETFEEYDTTHRDAWVIREGAIGLDSDKVAEIEAKRFKAEREKAVSEITVTVSNMVFDGDEESQNRMARALSSSDIGDSTLWKLADNTVTTVTYGQLKQALRLAGEAQTTLWMGV